ncbi:hypothetical protein SGRIM119S_06453 [Streptomyces griseorubiginosus]
MGGPPLVCAPRQVSGGPGSGFGTGSGPGGTGSGPGGTGSGPGGTGSGPGGTGEGAGSGAGPGPGVGVGFGGAGGSGAGPGVGTGPGPGVGPGGTGSGYGLVIRSSSQSIDTGTVSCAAVSGLLPTYPRAFLAVTRGCEGWGPGGGVGGVEGGGGSAGFLGSGAGRRGGSGASGSGAAWGGGGRERRVLAPGGAVGVGSVGSWRRMGRRSSGASGPGAGWGGGVRERRVLAPGEAEVLMYGGPVERRRGEATARASAGACGGRGSGSGAVRGTAQESTGNAADAAAMLTQRWDTRSRTVRLRRRRRQGPARGAAVPWPTGRRDCRSHRAAPHAATGAAALVTGVGHVAAPCGAAVVRSPRGSPSASPSLLGAGSGRRRGLRRGGVRPT